MHIADVLGKYFWGETPRLYLATTIPVYFELGTQMSQAEGKPPPF